MDPVEQLRWNLTNHRPTDAAIDDIEVLRAAAIAYGELILLSTPPCREQSLALTNLEQATMWAVAAIARNRPADEVRPA